MPPITIHTLSPINGNLGRRRECPPPSYVYFEITFPFTNPFEPKPGIQRRRRRRRHSNSSQISNVGPTVTIIPRSATENSYSDSSGTPESATFSAENTSRKSSMTGSRSYISPRQSVTFTVADDQDAAELLRQLELADDNYLTPDLLSPAFLSPNLLSPKTCSYPTFERRRSDRNLVMNENIEMCLPRIEISDANDTTPIDWSAYQFLEDDMDFLPEDYDEEYGKEEEDTRQFYPETRRN